MTNLGQIDACLLTDKGQVRDRNEDYFAQLEPATEAEERQYGWLYLVADGVGGADAGEVASRFAAERTVHHFVAGADPDWSQRLEDAMLAANVDLRAKAADQPAVGRGMATTMVALVIQGDEAILGNVGDSRGYHWRAGELRQVTKDQSLVAKLVEEGAITPEQAASHRHKNVILSSLGSERQPQIDLFRLPLAPGDALVLCSDGLTRHVADEEIGDCLAGAFTAEAAARQLLQLAYDRGGVDNISVAVVRYRADTAVTRPMAAGEIEPAAEPAPLAVAPALGAGRALLWVYTGFLCIVQTVLILLVWVLLQT